MTASTATTAAKRNVRERLSAAGIEVEPVDIHGSPTFVRVRVGVDRVTAALAAMPEARQLNGPLSPYVYVSRKETAP